VAVIAKKVGRGGPGIRATVGKNKRRRERIKKVTDKKNEQHLLHRSGKETIGDGANERKIQEREKSGTWVGSPSSEQKHGTNSQRIGLVDGGGRPRKPVIAAKARGKRRLARIRAQSTVKRGH